MALSLEHDGRTLFCRCARSNGIIGGSVRTIFDSLTGGGGCVCEKMVMVMGDKVDKHEREERKHFEEERNVPVLPLGDFRQYRLVQ